MRLYVVVLVSDGHGFDGTRQDLAHAFTRGRVALSFHVWGSPLRCPLYAYEEGTSAGFMSKTFVPSLQSME